MDPEEMQEGKRSSEGMMVEFFLAFELGHKDSFSH